MISSDAMLTMASTKSASSELVSGIVSIYWSRNWTFHLQSQNVLHIETIAIAVNFFLSSSGKNWRLKSPYLQSRADKGLRLPKFSATAFLSINDIRVFATFD